MVSERIPLGSVTEVASAESFARAIVPQRDGPAADVRPTKVGCASKAALIPPCNPGVLAVFNPPAQHPLDSAPRIRYRANMTTLTNLAVLLLTAGALVTGCGADHHAKKVQSAQDGRALTLGTVQQEIRVGMSGGDVAEALGSPNIVSTDEQGREVWIYDRFATEVVYSESQGGVWLLLGAVSGSSGAASRSQRTLTVVVKFDENKRVRDFAYHQSRF